MDPYDVVVLGAGAAGLMCAIAAGRRGRRVLVIDHASKAGSKILISGGGRCNFTNLDCRPDRFLSANPHFCKSALARYTPADFLALIGKHGIAWHEKTLGQLFCDGSAREIVAMLLAECDAARVEIRLGQSVQDVTRADRFRVSLAGGDVCAAALVLATGGLSIPKMGATGFAHDVARRFGLALVAPRPALVPLTLPPDWRARAAAISGVSLPVVASAGRARFAEAMLFTHRGLSGPAILQISSYWTGGPVTLDLLPGLSDRVLVDRKRARPEARLRGLFADLLPQRAAELFLPDRMRDQPAQSITDRALVDLAAGLKQWQVTPAGTEGYAKAEVTAGGVDTAGLLSRSMQAKAVPGLFVVGEAVDVTGWLGGYNFQWAWASGWCAGSEA